MNRKPTATSCDVLILGAGMSGLALASQIASYNNKKTNCQKSTIIIEPRTNYEEDRTWCYWKKSNSFFDSAITHKWHKWKICSQGKTYISKYSNIPYVRVNSRIYYKLAQKFLEKSNGIRLINGVSAKEVLPFTDKVKVKCDDISINSKYVYDTRPKDIPDDTLLQHFGGLEIKTTSDTFDTEVVTLMDFKITKGDDIHFFYILPFSTKHALVETTHFSKNHLSKDAYKIEIERYLRNSLHLKNWQIVREEYGVIPMYKNPPTLKYRKFNNIIPLGLHANTTRPSTGYCYPHAQKQALDYSKSLSIGNPTLKKVDRNVFVRWLDMIFISFLENHPQKADAMFMNLFRKTSSEALINFLSDDAKFCDYMNVIMAMPKKTFIYEALRCVIKS